MQKLLIYGLVAAAIVAAALIFRAPFRWGLKLLVNTVLGLVLLFLFNLLGRHIGVTLGVNLVNGLIMGALGPAGLVLLLVIRWLTF